MNGSKKQIKWANEIKSKIAEQANMLKGKDNNADIVMDKLLDIDVASFWIDYRDCSIQDLLYQLQHGGLSNKGFGHSNKIIINSDFSITETWTEIVSDGKGGRKEEKTKVW